MSRVICSEGLKPALNLRQSGLNKGVSAAGSSGSLDDEGLEPNVCLYLVVGVARQIPRAQLSEAGTRLLHFSWGCWEVGRRKRA